MADSRLQNVMNKSLKSLFIHHITNKKPEPKEISSDEVADSPLDSAKEIFQKELARLKGQEQRATSDAKDTEDLQERAIPTGSVPVPTVEPRSVAQALEDLSWVDAMQEEMKQFKFQNVWVLVDLPEDKYAIGTKQEEGIDYDKSFAPVGKNMRPSDSFSICSYWDICVYQMDVKSAFLYGRIDEEVYVTQPKGFVDLVMKVVPPPLSGDYTPLSDHTDLDESQMSYGTKSSTSGDSNSVSNDFVSCDNSDKSSEVNSNDFASSDSSVKSSEPKSEDSTSCASTSSVSTSESEAEFKSMLGHLSMNPLLKNASSLSMLCFVCGSSTHLIKDCDFYEKQMANKTVGIGVGTVHSRNHVNHQNQFVPQAVLLRTGKVKIPSASPQPVPTGKPKVPEPVLTGRQNRSFPVPTDRRYSPSVTFGWWKSTARPMPHLNRPTSSYVQTYTPYVPQVCHNHMQYGGVRWATAVKPSAGCSWKTLESRLV
ncbi:putative ribonuclease H-like domain-containing protein [Tanacetum coccineum]